MGRFLFFIRDLVVPRFILPLLHRLELLHFVVESNHPVPEWGLHHNLFSLSDPLLSQSPLDCVKVLRIVIFSCVVLSNVIALPLCGFRFEYACI